MLDKLNLTMATPLQRSLFAMSEQAKLQGRPDLEAECLACASKLPDAQVQYKLSAAEFFANACDQARARNKPDEVEALETLVVAIKQGSPVNVILGSMSWNNIRTPGDITKAAEAMAKQALRKAGG